jgi:threonine/homoserine/homoserine lactone efflux protein
METLFTFCVAFVCSFVGTIPPGTLSLTIIELGLKGMINTAWRMAIAAALIEYPYAWVAVKFQGFLTRSLEWTHSFHLVSGVVMVSLGIFSLWGASRPSDFTRRFEASGFRRGVVLSLINPLAIPFWMAITAYLRGYGWIDLSDNMEIHAYLLGVSMGTLVLFITLVLFMVLAYLAKKVVAGFTSNAFLQKTPGALLILLGVYAFAEYIFG